MDLSTAFVLTKQTTERRPSRHSPLMKFLDLIDACGFNLIIGATYPELDKMAFYKLIFVDASAYPLSELFESELFSSVYKNRIVLFGLNNDFESEEIEATALKAGACGIFYENDKLEIVIKGIQQIKNGKLWFKRDTLESTLQELLGDFSNTNTAKIQTAQLTKREHMIVVLIGQGAQNKEIADQLHISVNTVKTHVYSIYRKTSCRNRVELIKWSMPALKAVS